jgi:hypothetical protein
MRHVLPDTYRACFAFGLIAALGARKVLPVRDGVLTGYGIDGGESNATVEEWHAGEPPEVVARKVITSTSAEHWVRADLADAALARIAAEEAGWELARTRVVEWITEQDEANAAKRGMGVEEYRRVRNQQGMERDRRRGSGSWGIR